MKKLHFKKHIISNKTLCGREIKNNVSIIVGRKGTVIKSSVVWCGICKMLYNANIVTCKKDLLK